MYQARQATGRAGPIAGYLLTPWFPTGCKQSGTSKCPRSAKYAGLHQFDGQVQDLSPSGVAAMLAALGIGPKEPDEHDEAQLKAVEAGARASFELAEVHRWNPLVHLANLDLACYDREYAPAKNRAAAKARHIAAWPGVIAEAIESLDSVPAPVAVGLLPAVRGLAPSLVTRTSSPWCSNKHRPPWIGSSLTSSKPPRMVRPTRAWVRTSSPACSEILRG